MSGMWLRRLEVKDLAGIASAVIDLKPGVNVMDGKVTHEAVAEGTGMPYTPVDEVLGAIA